MHSNRNQNKFASQQSEHELDIVQLERNRGLPLQCEIENKFTQLRGSVINCTNKLKKR